VIISSSFYSDGDIGYVGHDREFPHQWIQPDTHQLVFARLEFNYLLFIFITNATCKQGVWANLQSSQSEPECVSGIEFLPVKRYRTIRRIDLNRDYRFANWRRRLSTVSRTAARFDGWFRMQESFSGWRFRPGPWQTKRGK